MKITTHSIWYVPLRMNTMMQDAMRRIKRVGAESEEYLMLSEDVSPWTANHYIAVNHDVPGAEMVELSGTYAAEVFEGEFQEMPNWHRQLIDDVRAEGYTPKRTFFSYAYCPACAEAYGHNYVVGFEQIA